jgi:hypothetical protein
MKIDLKLVITFVVLIVLAAVVYLIEIRGGKESAEAEREAKKILTIDKDNVLSLRVKNEKGTFFFQRGQEEEERWFLRNPVETEAARSSVNDILWDLVDLELERKLEGKGLDLSSYGLDPPKIEVEVKEEDRSIVTLRIGEKYRGSLLYVQNAGENGVYITKSEIDSHANLDLYGFRNKKMSDYEWDSLIGMDLSEKGEPRYKLRYEGDRWNLIAPVQAEADSSDVNGIKDAVQDLKALEFVSEEPRDLEEYGLESPEYELTLLLEEGASQTLSFGKRAEYTRNEETDPKGYLFARSGRDGPVVVLGRGGIEEILADPDDLRERRLTTATRWDIVEIAVSLNGTHYELHKIEGNWFLDGRGEKPADEEKVDDILDALMDAHFVKFLDPPYKPERYGFTIPSFVVEIKTEEEEEIILTAGKEVAPLGHVFLKRNDQAGTVPTSDLEPFHVTPEELEVVEEEEEKTESM